MENVVNELLLQTAEEIGTLMPTSMSRKSDEQSAYLTWQRVQTPRFFSFLFFLFFIINIVYLGWLIAYFLEGGEYAWFFFVMELYRIGFCALAYYCLRVISYPLYEKPLTGKMVDVLIPTLNEDISVVEKTVSGAVTIRGIRNVFLLDDGNRSHIKEMAKRYGAVYFARTEHEHAKAGNMNFGLLHTDAEFLITLDADHVPLPEFLERTLGYFKDPQVAFVQTPQVFYNRQSIQHRFLKDNPDWSEQTMFYESIQPAKNTFNAAFFCGSSAILRRSAIDNVGGFATGTATEDIHTAIRLHSKKWKSVFINEKLAYGLAPDDLKEYYRQRVRWGAGSLGLLFRSSDSPLWCRGLTLMQRLCYLNSMLGFTQGEVKLLYYLLPLFILLTPSRDVPISVPLLLGMHIPYLFFMAWMTWAYSRGTYHPLFTEQYNIANIFSNIASLKGVIRIEKKFGVSIKTKKKMESNYINPVLRGFVLCLVIAQGYGFTQSYLTYQGDLSFLWTRNIGLALFWNSINIGMICSFLIFLHLHNKKKVVHRVESVMESPAFSFSTPQT